MTALPPDDEMYTFEHRDDGIAIRHRSGGVHMATVSETYLVGEVVRLRAELSALRAEREPVAWAITFDSGACHITHDPTFAEECRAVKKASVQALYAAPQAHPGEESAAIPASDSTVPPGDGAAACKG